jgi:Zn-dependent peptidase ImmA (M78 family)
MSLCKPGVRAGAAGVVDGETLPASLARELRANAAKARRGQNSLPIHLAQVCEQLGVRVLRKPSVKTGKAYLTWNRMSGEGPIVLLPAANISTWDRFCTAHELGHFFLISQHDWAPSAGSTYWATEAICDEFARELLLPTELIEDVARLSSASAKEAMSFCDALAHKARVPWIQAGKKLTEVVEGTVYLRLEFKESSLKVISSSLPRELGRSALISRRSDFFRLATELNREARATFRRVCKPVSRDMLVETRLGELMSE